MSVNFTDNSQEVLAAFERQVQRGLMAIGETAVGYAKEDAPYDTGRLEGSIDHAVVDKDVYIGTNVEYAPYQEFGTSRGVIGKHYLRNAAANHSAEYKNIMETSLKR